MVGLLFRQGEERIDTINADPGPNDKSQQAVEAAF